jgi:hypothetical protein
MMKQVVGGAFCGFLDPAAENHIIDRFIQESERILDEGISSIPDKTTLVNRRVERLMLCKSIFSREWN